MPILTRWALALTRFSARWVPSAFSIAGLLTLVTFALALGLTDRTASQCVRYWGDGFWVLAEFGMQMCLIMVTGAIIADSPFVRRGLGALARVPETERGAVVWMAFFSMTLCWVHWGLGMIASAFLARRIVLHRPSTDYRLLVATAYFGMGAVWHAGLSGSAPLLVATPGHFLEAQFGIIPASATIFSGFNLSLLAATMGALGALAWALYPANPADAYILDPRLLDELEDPPRSSPIPAGSPFLAWIEDSRLLNGILGLLGAAWLVWDTAAKGPALTFNKVNFFFLMLGLLAHPSPRSFAAAAERAASYVSGIIIQFPFYAGMYGIIKGAGLEILLGQWFVNAATPRTFPLIVYWYSGILNYFVPSGGSKWAIEGPYILEAAQRLGVAPGKAVLAYAWGDMATDMIQPFFCLPLLGIARLEFKDILGYEALAFIVCVLIGSAAFLL